MHSTLLRMKPAKTAGSGSDAEGRIIHGRVMARSGEAVVLGFDDGRVLEARRAGGCHMLPEEGDVALVYVGPGDVAYVLTVLEKAGPEAVLSFGEGVRIEAGRVETNASESLSLSAPEVDVDGARGSVAFLNFSLAAGDMDAKIRKLTTFAERVRSRVHSLFLTVRDSLRRVESMETVEAARLQTRVEKSWTLKAGSASVLAREDVDIDGEHINLG